MDIVELAPQLLEFSQILFVLHFQYDLELVHTNNTRTEKKTSIIVSYLPTFNP